MRHSIGYAVAMVFLFSSVALAEGDVPVRTISVSGTVEAKTNPDQIVWLIRLVDTDANLLNAKKRSDEKVTAVLALREELEVAEGDLETGHVSVSRQYERDQYGRRGNFKHFEVSRSVTIRQQDIRQFDKYLDTLLSSAEMEVSFNFESSRLHEVRAETRLKALQVARDKATAMAAVLGDRIGQVLTISEHPSVQGRQSAVSNYAFVESRPAVDLASEKFVPGAIDVRVTVYATFELE